MHLDLGPIGLRKPEPRDLDALYHQKNDPQIAAMLGGFSKGYTRSDLTRWMDAHTQAGDEVLYAIVDTEDRCLGHVGLYQIDPRAQKAEFAIMIGDRSGWGQGFGRLCTNFMVSYGFRELHLHRIQLQVLDSNERARKLYESIGFYFE